MGHRGRERMVRCEKCGREVRRDKALFIEKNIFSNPLERKDVYSETYNRVLTREVSYCISCGKHARLFDKKKKQQEAVRERAKFNQFRPQGHYGQRPRPHEGSGHQIHSAPAAETPAQEKPKESNPESGA